MIAILRQSIPRHLRTWARFGVAERMAGELPVGWLTELSDEKKPWPHARSAGKALRDIHGADVLVMGCAGMARYRKPLQDETGIRWWSPRSRGDDGHRTRAAGLGRG